MVKVAKKININKGIIDHHLSVLKQLQVQSGLFLASGQAMTGYNKAWLRDNFYTCLAFEEITDWLTVKKTWRAILNILLKHQDKINWAAQNKPHEKWQYIHARYNPETFDEYWEEWGNKQNDAVGAIIYKLADLQIKGQGVMESAEDLRTLQKLIDYVQSIEYWQDPDSGMWEEDEEVRTSSIGAVLAGLKKAKQIPELKVEDELIVKGEQALTVLLPRESKNHFCDLAQLSLIYPYQIIDTQQTEKILINLEYHLSKKAGIIRYKNDRYYNKNIDGVSEEAEWTMGFPWLAIIYDQLGNQKKAEAYLEKAMADLSNQGLLPELYYSNSQQYNENIPLAWAQSLLLIALTRIIKYQSS